MSTKSGANWKDTTRYFWKVKNIRGVRGKIAILTIVDLLLQNCFPCCLICWPTILCDIFKLSFIAHKMSLSFLPFPNNSAVFKCKKCWPGKCMCHICKNGWRIHEPAGLNMKINTFCCFRRQDVFQNSKKCIIKCQFKDEPCVQWGDI